MLYMIKKVVYCIGEDFFMNLHKKIIYRFKPIEVIKNSKLFDKNWYEKKYHINKDEAAKHYYTTGWKNNFEPSEDFSGEDYLKMNHDVNICPLLHYELWGKEEKRILHPASYYVINKKTSIENNKTIYKTKTPVKHNKCLIYAVYDEHGTIPEYVLYTLNKIKKSFNFILLIGDYCLENDEIGKIENLVNYAEFSKKNSFDFGGYKTGIYYLKNNNILNDIDELYLLNDSCYGPIGKLENVLKEMRKVECDFWGLVDYQDDENHVMPSSFYCLKHNVINDDYFLNFFDRIKDNLTKDQISLDIEKEFVDYLERKYKSSSFLSDREGDCLRVYADNPKPLLWPKKMLEQGYPFIRIKSLQGNTNENIEETFAYIKQQDAELYEIINRDLENRKNEKYDSFSFETIDDKKYVSFDIFDTLIVRPFVNPVDVFHYIEKSNYGLKGFCKERVNAEKRARIASEREDVTLDEIYEQIVPKFKMLKENEKQTELKLCKANPRIKALYRYAVRSSKEIIAVSDMYLDSDFLLELLHKNGFTEIKKVYVSSETFKTKATGAMYDYVIKDLKCKPEDIIHVGDNVVSDIENAKNNSLNAFKVDTVFDSFVNAQGNLKYRLYWNEKYNFAGSIHLSLLANRFNHFNPRGNYYTEIGYSLGGPLVLSYLTRIEEEAKLNNINHLMFAARDGYILQKIYDKYFGDISTSYAYLTRAVVLSATLDWCNEPRYLKSILMLASKKNHNIKVYENEKQNLKEFERKKKYLQKWSSENFENLNKHLVDCTKGKNNIAVVDMTTGKFTSLRGAKTILGDRVKMGFFTGTFSTEAEIPYLTFAKRDFIPDDTPMINMSEFLISSPEESIKGYNSEGPVYDDSDDEKRKERYESIIKGIENYIDDFTKKFGYDYTCMMTFEEWLEFCEYYIKNKNEIDKVELKKISFSTEPVKEQERVKI